MRRVVCGTASPLPARSAARPSARDASARVVGESVAAYLDRLAHATDVVLRHPIAD
jgi:hypothetical protein